MSRLPLIEWPNELVEQRIAFLTAAARFAPPSRNEDDEERRESAGGEARPRTDVQALTSAADLAFATDQSRQGWTLLRDAVLEIVGGPVMARGALQGAITGVFSTQITPDEYSFSRVASPRGNAFWFSQSYPPPTPLGLALIADLLFAAFVSSTSEADFQWLYDDASGLPVFRTGEPIVQALALFNGKSDASDEERYLGTQNALVANAVRWAEDLRLHQSDEYHWARARVRGPLIDLRRVAFEIVLHRRPGGDDFLKWRSNQYVPGLAGAIERFVSELAFELVELLEGGAATA